MTAIPPNPTLIQQGSVLFNFPVAQDSAYAIGALLNYILGIAAPVGTFLDSLLTPAQLWSELGSPTPYTWVLADGSSTITSVPNAPSYIVSSSTYSQVTGNTSIPDCRGVMRRGKNNGRSDGNQNPSGDLPLGQLTLDTIKSHFHTSLFDQATNSEWGQTGTDAGSQTLNRLQGFPAYIIFPYTYPLIGPSAPFYTGIAGTSNGLGGYDDTSPKNVPVNSYIRIN
jgi:hypothetical protein